MNILIKRLTNYIKADVSTHEGKVFFLRYLPTSKTLTYHWSNARSTDTSISTTAIIKLFFLI
jgi:hypothetical protein